MNPLSVAILQSGVIDRGMLEELRKWGAPLEIPEDLPPPPETVADALILLEDALQSEGMVITRETDFEVFRQYIATQKGSSLHYAAGGVEIDVPVVFGKIPTGEYVIPWKSESISDAMTNGETFLVDEGDAVFFSSTRELFFGDTQAFMICTPSSREPIEAADDDNTA